MSASKILFFLGISFIVGLAIESSRKIPSVLLWAFLLLALIAVVMYFVNKKQYWLVVGLCILGILLGIERYQMADIAIANNQIKNYIGDKKVILEGYVAADPDVRDTEQKLLINVRGDLLLVTTAKFPEYHYLDKLALVGKIKEPPVFEDFDYKNYLSKDGIYAIASYPDIKVLGKEHYTLGSFVYEKILFIKNKLKKSLESSFSLYHRDLVVGIVLGDTRDISEDMQNKLNVTGLRHITAISGANIIILSSILILILIFFGINRRTSFFIAVIFIWMYVAMTGLSASGVRAGIMGSILLLGQYLGRQNTSQRNIVLAAALMLIQSPMLLLYDIGFQLSFLASAGIIYVKPSFDIVFSLITRGRLKPLGDAITTTFAAQLFTLPIMVYNFGYFSYVALITNVLVVPVVSLILITGFLLAVIHIVSPALAFIFLPPCWAMTSYILWIMDFFAKPWASVAFSETSWIWLVAMYVVVIGFAILLQKKFKQHFY